MDIHILPALSDNYIYVLHDEKSHHTLSVDPAEAEPVLSFLETRGWTLTHVLTTHHHFDHVGGNAQLKKTYPEATFFAPSLNSLRFPGVTKKVADNSLYNVGDTEVRVLSVPGHTEDHVAYWLPGQKALFPGDTLFSVGCGRLFGGTAEALFESLKRLAALPDDTNVYCAHEYTAKNCAFALTVDPDNPALKKKYEEVVAKQETNAPTLPFLLREDKHINPFLRTHSAKIRSILDMKEASDIDVFAMLRARKDHF